MIFRRLFSLVPVVFLITAALAFGSGNKEATSASKPAGKGYTIGFSNSYAGNTYRQTEQALFKQLADKMVANGTLKSYTMLLSNNNVATQVSQIESLVLDGVSAIIIDPGSASGLNGAIAKAHQAGIPVIIVNDGPVTSTECYQINFDTTAMATKAVDHLAALTYDKGNIIEIRGQAGVPFDTNFHDAVIAALKKFPNIKIVGSVYGQWTTSIAQQQVASILPSMPHIDGVLGQGGDAYGALQAFEAAGRPIPIVIGGNRGNFLTWWAKEKAKNGYKTFSWAANPWSAASALYVAVDILNGVKVPMTMIMPALDITQSMVDNFTNLKANEVAAKGYDHAWIEKTYYKE